jgi:hypothetical protein
VVVLAINCGDKPEAIREFTRQGNATVKILHDPEAKVSTDAFGVEAFSTCLVVGPDGKIAWRGIGADETAIRAVLEKTGR